MWLRCRGHGHQRNATSRVSYFETDTPADFDDDVGRRSNGRRAGTERENDAVDVEWARRHGDDGLHSGAGRRWKHHREYWKELGKAQPEHFREHGLHLFGPHRDEDLRRVDHGHVFQRTSGRRPCDFDHFHLRLPGRRGHCSHGERELSRMGGFRQVQRRGRQMAILHCGGHRESLQGRCRSLRRVWHENRGSE